MWVRSIQLLCCSDLEEFLLLGLIENLKKWVAAGYTLAHHGGAIISVLLQTFRHP